MADTQGGMVMAKGGAVAPAGVHGFAQAVGDTGFWDVGDQADLADQLTLDHEFSALAQSSPRRPIIPILALAVASAFLCWWAYTVFVVEEDPVDGIRRLTAWLGINAAPEHTTPVLPTPAAAATKSSSVAPLASAKADGDRLVAVPGNPYWALPNGLLTEAGANRLVWTPEEEDLWQAGVAHKYVYQHYKTVLDIRARRLAGSETILWQAIKDKKLWVRMAGAIGLAEFGTALSLTSFAGVLAGERSELLANYFERYVKRASPAELFVMRQCLRMLDERGRVVVLRAIARSPDQLRELYLAAASLDPAPKVQRWLRQLPRRQRLPESRLATLLPMIQGQTPLTSDLKALVDLARRPPQAPQSASDADQSAASDADDPESDGDDDTDPASTAFPAVKDAPRS